MKLDYGTSIATNVSPLETTKRQNGGSSKPTQPGAFNAARHQTGYDRRAIASIAGLTQRAKDRAEPSLTTGAGMLRQTPQAGTWTTASRAATGTGAWRRSLGMTLGGTMEVRRSRFEQTWDDIVQLSSESVRCWAHYQRRRKHMLCGLKQCRPSCQWWWCPADVVARKGAWGRRNTGG
jgi:hypothetical protein